MSEHREKLETFKVTKLCAVCGAPMVATGYVFTSNPPQYPHRCKDDPSHPEVSFDRSYPAPPPAFRGH